MNKDNKTALVLEGGGLRGIYSSAVLDYFIEKKLEFPYIVGVSAGAIMAASYLSKQRERNLRINTKYLQDKRYMSVRNIIKEGAFFSKDFAYRKVPNILEPFDYHEFYNSSCTYKVGAFDCEKGKNTYVNLKEEFDKTVFLDTLMASGSLPFLSKPVEINGNLYLDGGLGESIPIFQSIRDNNEKHVVILTRHKDYRKKERTNSLIAKVLYKKYPKVAEAIIGRGRIYNSTLEYINILEKENKIFIIRPSSEVKVDRLETNPEKIRALYQQGRSDIASVYDDLIAFLNS